MKFELLDSLIIVTIESKNYLVDTGSNMSFSLNDKNLNLVINGNHYLLKPNLVSANVKDTLHHLIPGKVVDGVIGTNIICETSLTIDYLNQEIYFEAVKCKYDIEQYSMPLNIKMGLIYTELKSRAKTLSVILDTGAKIHYVKESYLDKTKSRGYFEDYSPDLGQMEGHLFDFYDSIHDETVTAGILPAVYNYACDMIMSVYLMARPGFCSFDFVKGEFKFTRRFI